MANGIETACLRCLVAWAVLLANGCAGGAGKATATGSGPPSTATGGNDRIDLELTEVDTVEALGAIAMAAHVNLFVDADVSGNVSVVARSTPWKDVLASFARDHRLRVEPLRVDAAKHPAFWVSKQSSPPAPETKFSGAPITVSFDETPIRAAAATLSELAKANITVDADVQASVTLHMRGIAWDLALYHLAQKYELRIVRRGNEIEIARR